MLKSFPSIIERMKQDLNAINELMKVYELDGKKPLSPQVEQKIARKLTRDEKQTIEIAVKAIKIRGDKPRRRSIGSSGGGMKKK